jgi:hypothetical protein
MDPGTSVACKPPPKPARVPHTGRKGNIFEHVGFSGFFSQASKHLRSSILFVVSSRHKHLQGPIEKFVMQSKQSFSQFFPATGAIGAHMHRQKSTGFFLPTAFSIHFL